MNLEPRTAEAFADEVEPTSWACDLRIDPAPYGMLTQYLLDGYERATFFAFDPTFKERLEVTIKDQFELGYHSTAVNGR